MNMPLRDYADDHVRTVVAAATGLRLPAPPQDDEGEPVTDRPDEAAHPGLPLLPTGPERQERTP
ncbi:hypothetical protein [Streptomyces griseorubiginosus]|uniref:Uncharacterized protein n=1 Tax=Streptomyces griseorubiginosus TaxID=67304 RepID=A0AAI8PSW9_9ACTN|nr:hypothetical protein [Streptomyces griseorubiginosus]AYC43671.1 hypothetical protein DWG14_07979 [Streptomyces griseorubiginosus]